MAARTVAGFAIPIRRKLLIAFLGITALMTGLALLGLSALQQANARTERILRDQERMAVYHELNSTPGVTAMMAFALAGVDPGRANDAEFIWLEAPATALANRMGDLAILLGQASRRFGAPGSSDHETLNQLRDQLNLLTGLVLRIKKLRESHNFAAVEAVVFEEFAPIALQLQGETYTIIQMIEAEMAQRARRPTHMPRRVSGSQRPRLQRSAWRCFWDTRFRPR